LRCGRSIGFGVLPSSTVVRPVPLNKLAEEIGFEIYALGGNSSARMAEFCEHRLTRKESL
jgi:hypothetical protein